MLEDILLRDISTDPAQLQLIDAVEILLSSLQQVVDAASLGGSPQVTLATRYCSYYQQLRQNLNLPIESVTQRIPFTDLFTNERSDEPPNALRWIAHCMTAISDSATSVNIESLFVPGACSCGRNKGLCGAANLAHCPCPALQLSRRFLRVLADTDPLRDGQTDQTLASPQHAPATSAMSMSWPLRVADAFVRSSGGKLTLLSILPPALRSTIELALLQCRERPMKSWPPEILMKIGRNDLCAHLVCAHDNIGVGIGQFKGAGFDEWESKSGTRNQEGSATSAAPTSSSATANLSSSDGLVELERDAGRLRFADDDRVHEVNTATI
jgi:hypothetical protein